MRDAEEDEDGGRVPGKLLPRLRKRLDKDLEENYVDKHLVDENNLCLANEEQCEEIIMKAKARIKKMGNAVNVDRKYYKPGSDEEHPKFDVGMTAGELKKQLIKASNIKNDIRFKWTD